MKIAIPKEIEDGELRVAMTPAVAERVKQLGFEVVPVQPRLTLMKHTLQQVLKSPAIPNRFGTIQTF